MNNRAYGSCGVRLAAWALAFGLVCSMRASAQTPRGPGPEPVLQYLHADRVYDVAFAAHSPLVATVGGDGVVDLWSTRDWSKRRSLRVDESGSVWFGQGIALSPDGQSLARCAAKGGVELWNTSSGRLSGVLGDEEGQMVAVVWSTDGRFIAAAGKSILLWEVASGRLLRTIGGAYTCLGLTRDGKLLGAANDSRADIFDVNTGRRIRSLKDKVESFAPIALSADGMLVATGGEDPSWDPGPLPRDEEGNTYGPSEAFYAHELKVKVWDVRTGRRLRMLPGHWSTSSLTRALQFTPDGRRLFSGGYGVSTLWDLRTAKAVRSWKTSYSSQLSPDGRSVAISWNGLSFYRASDGKRISQLHPPPIPAKSLAFSADGTRLAVGEEWLSTIVRIWDVSAGELVRAFQGPPPNLREVMFLPDGKVVGNSYNGIYVWDTASAKIVRKAQGPATKDESGAYHQWAFLTPDGRRMISESDVIGRRGLRIWDWATHKLERAIPSPTDGISGSVVSQDGAYLALPSGFQQMSVNVYELATGKQVSELAVTDKYAVNLRFSPDGETIAGYNAYGRVSLWDRATGRLKRSIDIGDVRSGELSLGFTTDGRLLAAAHGNQVRFFNAATGELAKSVNVAEPGITALAFAPGGCRLAIGREDGFIELWDLNAERLLLTMVGFTALDRTKVSAAWIAYTPDGFYDWSGEAENLIRWRVDGKLYPAAELAKRLRRRGLLQSLP